MRNIPARAPVIMIALFLASSTPVSAQSFDPDQIASVISQGDRGVQRIMEENNVTKDDEAPLFTIVEKPPLKKYKGKKKGDGGADNESNVGPLARSY